MLWGKKKKKQKQIIKKTKNIAGWGKKISFRNFHLTRLMMMMNFKIIKLGEGVGRERKMAANNYLHFKSVKKMILIFEIFLYRDL